jgi:recombination protein RecT
MPKSEIDKHRARSKAGSSGPWVTDYEEMAKKTVFRSIFKWLPVSIEQVMATTGDGAVAKYNANAVDADDALEVEFVAAEDDGTVEAVEEAPVGVDEAVDKMAEQMKV